MPDRSLSKSLQIFLNSAVWLTDEDAALVAACEVMARTLDAQIAADELVPSLMSQFTMSVTRLRNLKPKPKPVEAPKPVDPLEALLNTDGPTLNLTTPTPD